jgi:hypothetical protein
MTDDSMQGMLFGSIDPSTSNRDAGTGGQLQLCALNSGSPGPARAERQPLLHARRDPRLHQHRRAA